MKSKNSSKESDADYYSRLIADIPVLSKVEMAALTMESRSSKGLKAKKARDQMINSNLRLVVKIVKNHKHLGLPLSDGIAEGIVGLIKAVDGFDPTKGMFSTYAVPIIKQHFYRGINRMKRLLHLSEDQREKIINLGRVSDELYWELSREASDEEIAARMRISEAAVAELRLTKKAFESHPSLDEPITEEGGSATLHEILPDPMSSNPFETLSRKSRLQEIDELLSQLDERERYVINARHALDGSDRKTLQSIGKEMGVTGVRICQIKGAALKKMHAELLKKKQAAGA